MPKKLCQELLGSDHTWEYDVESDHPSRMEDDCNLIQGSLKLRPFFLKTLHFYHSFQAIDVQPWASDNALLTFDEFAKHPDCPLLTNACSLNIVYIWMNYFNEQKH